MSNTVDDPMDTAPMNRAIESQDAALSRTAELLSTARRALDMGEYEHAAGYLYEAARHYAIAADYQAIIGRITSDHTTV